MRYYIKPHSSEHYDILHERLHDIGVQDQYEVHQIQDIIYDSRGEFAGFTNSQPFKTPTVYTNGCAIEVTDSYFYKITDSITEEDIEITEDDIEDTVLLLRMTKEG